MRNASDIFFLKEDSGDSTNIFSVNGSCPMKIRRRRQTPQNDCFEYGRSQTELSEELQKGVHEDAEDNDTEEEGAVLVSTDLEDRSDVMEKNVERKEQKIEMKVPERKLQSFATSSMKRNILTGAGMEIVEHRKPKKGLNRREKGLW